MFHKTSVLEKKGVKSLVDGSLQIVSTPTERQSPEVRIRLDNQEKQILESGWVQAGPN